MFSVRLVASIIVATCTTTLATATSIKDVELADLFKEADVVALVDIVAADGEGFDDAVYKAIVVAAFKGVQEDDVVYFGPYVHYRLGSEYVVFLKRTTETLAQIRKDGGFPWLGTDEARYHKIMYAGYSVLPVEYTCTIPGCDDGVSVPGSQVHLPKQLPTTPDECNSGSRYDTWVRKNDFLRLLRTIQETQ